MDFNKDLIRKLQIYSAKVNLERDQIFKESFEEFQELQEFENKKKECEMQLKDLEENLLKVTKSQKFINLKKVQKLIAEKKKNIDY